MESIVLCYIFLEIIFKCKFILEILAKENENGLKMKMKMHFQNGFGNLCHFDYLEVLSSNDQDFNRFESLIKFLQVLEMKMKMELVKNEFDNFDKS